MIGLCEYIKESLIYEMSNINKLDSSYLPSNSYKIIVWENDHLPPHVHVKKDGFDIKFLIENGEFYGYGTHCKKPKQYQLNDIKKRFKLWLYEKHAGISNQSLAYLEWIRIYKSTEGFSKEFLEKMKEK